MENNAMVFDGQVSLSQHAIAISCHNNQAVAQILCGDYASATSTLTRLLKPARDFVRMYQSQLSSPSIGSSSQHCEDVLSSTRRSTGCAFSHEAEQEVFDDDASGSSCETTSIDQEDPSGERRAHSDSSSSSYLCTRPLELFYTAHQNDDGHATTRPVGEDAAGFSEVATYVIVYNLALCYHLRARHAASSVDSSTSTRKTDLLKHAVALYSCALNTIEVAIMRYDRVCGNIHSSVLLSNMVHASRSLGDKVSAKRYLHSLSETTMFVLVDESYSSVSEIYGGDEEGEASYPSIVNEILGNIAASIIGRVTTAPAA